MEHRTWIWKKRSSEKIISVSGKSDLSSVENEEEKDKPLELEISIKDLNEQLSYARTESNVKDGLLAKQAKVAEEAIAGWEKAEAETASFKQDLDEALVQTADAEERIVNLHASLKECMHQLHVLKEEKQNTITDAGMKISREQEKARMLEERLAEANKKLSKSGSENSNVSRILQVKEKLIEELNESKARSEANFTAIVVRLDASEKISASLKYEVCMLQKELEIRNEEREFNLKSADAAHKQHLQNIKRITKLETECQRLRVMVRKRLPGPAALANMRTEVEILNSTTEIRRKKSNSTVDGSWLRDSVPEYCQDATVKNVASLIERFHASEDENKIIKETLAKKNSDLQSLRVMFARTASKLSQAETQLEELSRGQACLDLARSSPVSYDFPLASISEDRCNEDSISCTESWASALISELEHFKPGKPVTPTGRTVASLDFSLMDDFVEMEKLAIVCVDKPFENSSTTSRESNRCLVPKETDSKLDSSGATGMEVVPVDSSSVTSEANHRINDNIYHKSQSASLYAFDGAFLPNETINKLFQSDLEKSISKLIELIEGIIHRYVTSNSSQQMCSRNDGGAAPQQKSSSVTGYVARVFLWETSELTTLLHHFISVCKNLLHGKADLKNFYGELTSTLEWIVNHCFSFQDVSSMSEMTKNHFDGSAAHSDNEYEATANHSGTETENRNPSEEFKFDRSMPLLTTSNGLHLLSQVENTESKLTDENKRLKHEILNMASRKKVSEERLESLSAKNELLACKLEESNKSIAKLQVELATLKEIKGLIEDQIENQKLINEDLGTQLTVTKVKLDEYHQKLSNLEVELEDKSNCCDELEATCLELQLQLESVVAQGTPKYAMGQEQKLLRTDWEISTASEKLAECQETILNLGKQLKALASPKDAALFDKVGSTPNDAKIRRRPQLRDHIRREDNAESEDAKPQKPSAAALGNPNAGLLYGRKLLTDNGTDNSIKRGIESSPVKASETVYGSDESNRHNAETNAGVLTLLPKRHKGGVGLLRKLLSRRKRAVRN